MLMIMSRCAAVTDGDGGAGVRPVRHQLRWQPGAYLRRPLPAAQVQGEPDLLTDFAENKLFVANLMLSKDFP